MNSDKDRFTTRVVIILECLLFVGVCMAIYEYFLLEKSGFILVVIALLFFMGITSLYYRHKRITDKNLRFMLDALKNVISDTVNDKFVSGYGEEYREFYKEIDTLRESLLKKDESRQEILNIINSVAVNMELDKLLEDLLPKLITVTRSNCGAFYLVNNATNKMEIKNSMGFSKNIFSEFDITLGEGLIGKATSSKNISILTDIPDDSIYIMRTFLGKIKPKNVMVVPIVNQEQLMGVLVLASIYNFTKDQMEILDLIKYYVGVAVSNGVTYGRTKRLSNELKFQNKLIEDLNKDLELKVHERTSFLNNIVDSIKDYAIYSCDKDGNILFWNKGAELTFGYTAQETIGKHVNFIYNKDDVESGGVKRRIDAVRTEGKYIENGWRNKKDGTRYYADVMIFPMHNPKGEMIGFANVTRDITNLKNAERDLWFEKEFVRRVLDNSKNSLLITDNNGIIQIANKKASELFGVSDLIGRGVDSFFVEKEKLRESFAYKLVSSGQSIQVYTLIESGENVTVNISALVEESGDFKLFITIDQIKNTN